MLFAVIADIHGNYAALRAVLLEIDRLGCDCTVSLGDVAGYYCQVNECIEELWARGIPNLLGNHDHYIVSNLPCPRSASANRCLEYQRTILKPECKEWLSRSARSLHLPGWSVRHGGWNDALEEYLTEIREPYFEALPDTHFISAHTHVQTLAHFGRKVYANPGSVGQPRDGNWKAAFATIEGTAVSLHRTAYDVEETMDRMAEAGFASYFYENLRNGTRIGGQITEVRIDSVG